MLEDLSTARASIDSLGHTLSGRVRISVPTGFGRMFLGGKLLDFARMHPGIALTVTFNNRIEDLIASEVDVAIRITATPPLDYVARNICSIRVNPLARACCSGVTFWRSARFTSALASTRSWTIC